ncbi:hypothetical protein HF086_016431 [Spodoptera exigua]|uniref:Endonuclease n=1 Tax=Spodoptera exigua TaxID=7107 RepID=A0A922MRJ4_SPOEX|nr:hypothetical protein HF086_016431 [Spodoptera exigua]
MDAELVKTLLESIKMAISTNRRQDDISLPSFDPEKMHNGADSWCKNIEDLGAEFNWTSLQMVAKAGKALRGTAFSWFESWEPEHRDWETFRQDLVALFPTKKNLTEKLTKAVLYNSESAETYAEYAREKILLLKKTKVSFTEEQLVELVCGGVRDVNVRMASFNSSVNTTNELITLFSSYSKNPKKRPFEKNATVDDSSTAKKPRTDFATKQCFSCGQKGHIQFQCPKNSNNNKNSSDSKASPKSKDILNTSIKNLKCGYCKKEGHSVEKCWTKQRVDREKQNIKPVNCLTQSGLKLTKIYINDITVDALIDTGANCSIIKESIAFRLGCHVSPWTVRLDGIGSGHVNTFGKITVPVRFNDVCIELDLNVVSNDFVYDCIIGQDVVKYADIAIITDTSGTKLVRKNIVNLNRATNFSNVSLTNLFREWNVDHHMISTGTPRSNGQIERYVATIINMLSTICNNEAEWPNSLYKVQQTLNTTIQKASGFSPLRLLIGRDSNIPSVQARLADIEEPGPSNVNQIIDIRADRVLAYKKMKSAADKYKSRFDTTRRDNISYEIGDIVYVSQDHRRHSKLSPKYKGPYEIIEILQNDRYRLRGQGRLHNIVIAKEKLRKWQGEWSEENQTAEQALTDNDSSDEE